MRSPLGAPSVETRRPPERIARRGRRARTRRPWMDMAGAKTLDLLVGVVLVLQCVRNVHAGITTGNGKESQLQQRGDAPAPSCRAPRWPRAVSHRWNRAGEQAAPETQTCAHETAFPCRSPPLPLVFIPFSRLVFHHVIPYRNMVVRLRLCRRQPAEQVVLG